MIRILKSQEVSRGEILKREDGQTGLEETVREIINTVRQQGDKALFQYSRDFDNAELQALEVTEQQIDWGFRQADPQLVEILYMAAERIQAFHQKQVRTGYIKNDEPGIITGQKVLPLKRVGIYVPGGTAAYPSSVLMNALPAKIAGVEEIIMVTPPGKNGSIPPIIFSPLILLFRSPTRSSV